MPHFLCRSRTDFIVMQFLRLSLAKEAWQQSHRFLLTAGPDPRFLVPFRDRALERALAEAPSSLNIPSRPAQSPLEASPSLGLLLARCRRLAFDPVLLPGCLPTSSTISIPYFHLFWLAALYFSASMPTSCVDSGTLARSLRVNLDRSMVVFGTKPSMLAKRRPSVLMRNFHEWTRDARE